jgi:hypothetical protein
MRIRTQLVLGLIVLLIPSQFVWAEIHYIRVGATGNNDGSNWTNAFNTIPSELKRGDTYYVASGHYILQSDRWGNGAYLFDETEEENKYITIRKAIANDHGTNSGWENEYGERAALFTATGRGSIFAFITSYYIFDGQVGGEQGNKDGLYGFKIEGTIAEQNMIDIRSPNWHHEPMPSNIVLSHIEIKGRDAEPDSGTNENGIVIPFVGDPDKGLGAHNITIDHCYLHDFTVGQPLLTNETVNFLFEYNYIARLVSTPTNHSEGWQDVGSDEVIARYNIWEDFQGTAAIALKRDVAVINNDWEIYGNVFVFTPNYSRDGVGMGVVCATNESAPANNILFYNNTIIHLCGFRSGIYLPNGTGNKAFNNIWYNCSDYYRGDVPNLAFEGNVEHDYNVFCKSVLNSSVSPNEFIMYDDPFVDWEHRDYRLKKPTIKGLLLDSAFSVDAFGLKRGADNNWDCGAFEYEATDSTDEEIEPLPELSPSLLVSDNSGNGLISFSFTLPSRMPIILKVYNSVGIEIRIIDSKELTAGTYSRTFDTTQLPPGIYICCLQTGLYKKTTKFVVRKMH